MPNAPAGSYFAFNHNSGSTVYYWFVDDINVTAASVTPTYTVTFNSNGGSGSMSNQTFTAGVAQPLSSNTFTRTNYTFARWNTQANGSGTSYTNGQSITATGNMTLYAQWTPVTPSYTLTYNAYQSTWGSISVMNGSTSVASGSSVAQGAVLNITATPSSGHAFTGWSVSGSGSSVANASSTTTTLTMGSANTTLTANFTPLYTISWTNPTGGTITVTQNGNPVSSGSSFQSGTQFAITATASTGYVFNGWTSSNGGIFNDASSASTTFTLGGVSTTLTASFTSSGSGGSGDCDGIEKSLGSGEATNNYLPSYNYYNYSLTQQIYTASEIGMAGTINSISFYNGVAQKTRTYDIYLKTTAKTSFNDAKDWVAVSASDKVYTGSVTMTVGDWTTINFSTPFEYDGTSNLILTMDDNSGAYTSSPHMACRVYDAADYQAVYVYSDGTNYDPASPPTSIQSNNSTLNKKNQVKFCITPAVTASLTVTGDAGCSGQATTLTAHPSNDFTSAARYSWGGTGVPSPSSNLTSNTIDVTPPSAGSYTYTCTVTEGNLQATAEVTISVFTTPTITFPGQHTFCGADEITAQVSGLQCGEASYEWSGKGTGTNLTCAASEGGTYTFTVSNRNYKQYDYIIQNGVAAIVVDAAATKAVPIGNDGIGDNTSAGDIAYTHSSNWPNLQEAIKVNGGETYTGNREGFLIDGGTCESTESVVVSINTPSVGTLSITDKTICSGGNTTLTVNSASPTGTLSYAWSNSLGSNATSNSISAAGTYTVSVTATNVMNGVTCTSSRSTAQGHVSVNTPSVGTLSITDKTICSGGNTTLTVNSASPTGTLSYAWSNSLGSNATSGNISSAGTYTVSVTATNVMNGVTCSSSQSTAQGHVSVNTPNIENATSYDYIWKGGTAGHLTDWNAPSNWYIYNSGYSVATELPTTAKNIYIGPSQCVTSIWPSQTGEANANNITIASGASLTIPASKILNIAGSITNNGTFTANNSSTIVFKGSATQTLSSAMTFGNVTFAQTALDTIKAPNGIIVNGTATFNKGIVMGDMTFKAGATAANVTDSASFVAGKVTKHTGASTETNFTFPTGSASEGQPKVLGSIKVASLPANSETYVVFNQKSNGGGFSTSEMPRWWN